MRDRTLEREYWLPIEMALHNTRDSWLYIFYDENQKLYSRASTFPVPEYDTFLLTKNCRNTKPIHELAYKYYKGDVVEDSGIEGLGPILIGSRSLEAQAKQIAKIVVKLIHDEKVPSESIAILVPGYSKEGLL